MLDWLGDLGGLFDALYYLFAVLAAPFASYSLKATLLTALFRYRKADDLSYQKPDEEESEEKNNDRRCSYVMSNFDPKDKKDKQSLMESLKGEFRAMQPIKWINCLRSCFIRCCLCKKDYNKLIEKSQHRVMKELDLKKFISR